MLELSKLSEIKTAYNFLMWGEQGHFTVEMTCSLLMLCLVQGR